MARNTRIFTDVDLNFLATLNPNGKGDVVKKYDENDIKQSVRNLILTNHYERLFHPEIGSQVTALMFEPNSPMIDALLEEAITNTINNFEPRVRLLDVSIVNNPDNNRLIASITFAIVNTETPITIDLILQRTR